VPLQFTEDRRGGKGRELDTPTRVVTLDGLEQANKGHLVEIVDVFAAPGEPAGERERQALVSAN